MKEGFPAHLRHFGHGPRPAIAVHCSLSHGGAWRGVADALGDRLTLTAFDMPGHGQSPKWNGIDDIHDLCMVIALPLMPSAVDLIGHSFGATVALRLAIEHPEQVRSLSLYEPVLFAAARDTAPALLEDYVTAAGPYIESIASGDRAEGARLFNRIWGDARPWHDIPARTRAYMEERIHLIPAQDETLLGDRHDLLGPGRLERAAMPVLLMDGADSPPIIHAVTKTIAERLPDARVATVPGAGHMGPITHTKEVADAIGGLLEVS